MKKEMNIEELGLKEKRTNQNIIGEQENQNILKPEIEKLLENRIVISKSKNKAVYMYTICDMGEYGPYETISLEHSDVNTITKFIIQSINDLLLVLKPKCPVYESLSHSRTELMIALENNTVSKSSLEVIFDYISNKLCNIEYDMDWCKERAYVVDDEDIMTNYIPEMMDEDLSLLVQYILELDKLLQEVFVANRYIYDYAD